MKIHAPIYLVRMHKGEYNEYTMNNICAFKSKAEADHFIHRLQCSFLDLYNFYSDEVDGIKDTYGTEYAEYPNDIFEKWRVFSDKRNQFYGAIFDIETIQIRRFH